MLNAQLNKRPKLWALIEASSERRYDDPLRKPTCLDELPGEEREPANKIATTKFLSEAKTITEDLLISNNNNNLTCLRREPDYLLNYTIYPLKK